MTKNHHIKLDLEAIKPPKDELLVEKNSTYPTLSVYYSFLGYQDSEFVGRKIEAWLHMIRSYRPHVIVSDCCLEASIVSKITKTPCSLSTSLCFKPITAFDSGKKTLPRTK